MSRARAVSKIGKKFCFPDVPSNWIRGTVDWVEKSQNYLPRKRIFYPDPVPKPGRRPRKVKLEEYEEDEKWCFYRFRIKEKEIDKFRFYYDHVYRFGINEEKVENEMNVDRNGLSWCYSNLCEVMKYLTETRNSNYNNGIGIGSASDVMSRLRSGYLIRNNGDKVDGESVIGVDRSVLVCCFYVPVFWRDDTTTAIQGMLDYHAASGEDFDVVMVAKMRRDWVDDEDAFNHFFSGFPPSCLAIPFSDTLRRDSVCTLLGLNTRSIGLLVDRDRNKKSQYLNFTEKTPFNVYVYPEGEGEGPYSSQIQEVLDTEFLYKINHNYNPATVDICGDKVSIAELKGKLVGLYLCYEGSFIRTLDLISRECKARNQDFQVVMVYIPFEEGVNPRIFMEAINRVLQNLNISTNSNWLVSPFNYTVSLLLWDVYDHVEEDKLIILDPHKKYGDPYGTYVFDLYGIDAYPFTRGFMINKELEALRAATLESWLGYGARDYVVRMDFNDTGNIIKVPIKELRGKIILFYVGWIYDEKYDAVLDWYNWNKTIGLSDFEIVFFHMEEQVSSPMQIPWLVCPFDPKYASFVQKKVLDRRGEILVAFGKDGHIVTLDALDLLHSYGPKGFPSFEWYDGLRMEVIKHLHALHAKFNPYDLVDLL